MDYNTQFKISPEVLIKAMKGEQDAIHYYDQLMKMTSNEQDIDIIQDIRNDEVKHFNLFASLYTYMTRQKPRLPAPKAPQISSFVGGVKQAIMDEIDAYEFYRDVYLANDDMQVRDTFFEALTDENEHAVKYNYLFTKSLEN